MKIQRYWRAAACAALFGVAPCAMADAPAGYYDSLEGLTGVQLKKAVKAIVKGHHSRISYGDATWTAFRLTDVREENGTKYWWDMYSNEKVVVGSSKPNNSVMNIEHSVAKSWWGGGTNDAYCDICHLNPSNSDANSRKSNYPLAEAGTVSWTNGVTIIGKPKSGQGGGASSIYEPCDEYKGDMARVFMYMFTVYDDISWGSQYDWMYDTSSDLTLQPWAYNLLLKWSANDPVSVKERNRNDGIMASAQKGRNPFIDLPDLAEYIWGSKSGKAFHLNGTVNPDPVVPTPVDPTPTEGEVNYLWLAETSKAMDEDWIISEVKVPEQTNYIWSWKNSSGKYYLNASAYINNTPYESEAYAFSPVVDLAACKDIRMSFDHAAKFQTTLKSLCRVVVWPEGASAPDELDIPVWPAAGGWTFVNSTNLNLDKYAGKKVQVGFKYASTSTGADTWEVRNVKLTATRSSSGIYGEVNDDVDDSDLVEVWGNNILVPAGAHIFDMNGREVKGEGLERGVYIVVKPTFKKNIKIYIK